VLEIYHSNEMKITLRFMGRAQYVNGLMHIIHQLIGNYTKRLAKIKCLTFLATFLRVLQCKINCESLANQYPVDLFFILFFIIKSIFTFHTQFNKKDAALGKKLLIFTASFTNNLHFYPFSFPSMHTAL
jgi:hypothetical protein